MLGVAFGIWAKNFEALTFLTTFILQPMTFLAGVFYPIATLPSPWNMISAFNPLHHNINIIRYAAIGYADGSPWISTGVIGVFLVFLIILVHHVVRKKLQNA
jgi:ABC-2 type transport system permease protein